MNLAPAGALLGLLATVRCDRIDCQRDRAEGQEPSSVTFNRWQHGIGWHRAVVTCNGCGWSFWGPIVRGSFDFYWED